MNFGKLKTYQYYYRSDLILTKNFKNMLDELNIRQSAGENDLFIKYVNNIPVVSKNSQNKINVPII